MHKPTHISPLKVAVIGAGNLSWNLIPALQSQGAEVIQLISRTAEKRNHFQETYGIPMGSDKLGDLTKQADLVFLTVSDHAIAGLANKLAKHDLPDAVFVHTSGSISLNALSPLGEKIGVFYPMQIFTQATVTPFSGIPLFLEGNESVLELLKPIADTLSEKVTQLDSEARLRLHAGAVMVCNFTNYLYRLAAEMAPGEGIKAYEPLIREHIEKVFSWGPERTQTGPAVRGDQVTLDKHMEILKDQPEQSQLYQIFSDLIAHNK